MVALSDTAGRVALELQCFETIPAGDHYSLLRVDARWVLAPGVLAPAPALVIETGGLQRRFAVLDFGDQDWGADWSAAFAVPTEALMGDPRVSLDGAGSRHELPDPTPGALPPTQTAEVVERNGRPHLLVAAGLMVVALAPLGNPALARAEETLEPAAAPATDQAVATDTATPGAPAPEAPADPVAPVADPAAPVTDPVAPVAASPEAPAPEAAAPAIAEVVEVPDAKVGRPHPRKHAEAPKKKHKKHKKHKASGDDAAKPTARRKRAKRNAIRRTRVAPARTVTPTPAPAPSVPAGLDPTPHVTSVPSPLLDPYPVPPFL